MGRKRIYKLIDVENSQEEVPTTPDRKKYDSDEYEHIEIKKKYTHLFEHLKKEESLVKKTLERIVEKGPRSPKVIYKDDLEKERKKRKRQRSFFKRVYKILDYSDITPRQKRILRKKRKAPITSWNQVDSGFVYYLTGKYDLVR